LKITDWLGEGTVVVIPDMIDGTSVVAIGRNALQKFGLTEITLGKNIKVVEDYAFADNNITKLTIPVESALEEIGEYAFRDNLLSTFIFPAKLKVLAKGAFSNNNLTSVTSNSVIADIGDIVFEKNKLIEVTLGNSITSFGKSVFSDNGRYVKIITENPSIPKLEKIDGLYGHVVGAISVVVKYIDRTTGEELRTAKNVGDDMTDIDNIFVIGEEVSLKPEKISGYAIQEEIFFTPDQDLYELKLLYTPTTVPPKIEVIKAPEVPLNTTAEELEDVLRSLIKATDAGGVDITKDVVIDPGDLDPTLEGTYQVIYTVTDRYGNETTKTVDVLVGSDWYKRPIGDGWVLGDFTYNNGIVTGLSAQGKAKMAALPAGERHLVLPDISPEGTHPMIRQVGYSQTNYRDNFRVSGVEFDSIDFSRGAEYTVLDENVFQSTGVKSLAGTDRLGKLISIGNSAFAGNQLTEISFAGMTSLKTIGNSAFWRANTPEGLLEKIDFSGATSLESIGSQAFHRHSHLKEITFGNLPSLKIIGDSAFNAYFTGSQNTTNLALDLSGLTGLVTIGSSAFSKLNLSSINTSNLVSLETIGNDAFYWTKTSGEVDLSSSAKLKSIGNQAFYNMGITSLILPTNSSLEIIGKRAIGYSKLTSIDLSNQLKLKIISEEAFTRNSNLRDVTMPGAGGLLESIEKMAFFASPIQSLVLADYPNFTTLGQQPRSSQPNTASLTSVEFRNLPKLTTIPEATFAPIPTTSGTASHNQISSFKLSDLPALTSIEALVITDSQLREVFIHNAPELTSVSLTAFHNNPGHPDYQDLVVLWVTPEEQVKIYSQGNYLVNPDKEAAGDWDASDFTYGDVDGLRGITGFTESGAGKLTNGQFPVVFPEKDPEGEYIKAIGPSAFRGSTIREADLSKMSQLEVIGDSAFYGAKMTSLNLSGLHNLKTIGDSAFFGNGLTSVDFSDLDNLENLGSSAFGRNDLRSLDLSPLTKITKIPDYAFSANNQLESIHFGDLPNITEIGISAFQKNNSQVSVSEVDLSGLTNLETIQRQAFQGQNIESLNLTGLDKLTTIQANAFSNNKLTSLDLSELKALKRIDAGAFQRNQLENINFGELPELATLGAGVFSYNKLRTVDLRGLPLITRYNGTFSHNNIESAYITDEVTALGSTFDYNDPAGDKVYKPVVVRTVSGKNPKNIIDRVSTTYGGFYVDPKIIVVNYVDEGGKPLRLNETFYNTIPDATSMTLTAPAIPGYVPQVPEYNLAFEDGINDYEYSFVYNKKDYSDLTMNIKVDHVNQGKETAKIGDVLITKLSLSASSADQALEGGKFKVYFDPSFVDISKVKVPALDDIYTVDIDPSGVITIAFKDDVQGGDYYAIPIEWAFKEGSTPQNYEMEIVTELLDKDDKVVMVPKDDDGNHYFPIISGYYEEPILRKGAPTPDNQQGFAGGIRPAGTKATIEIDGKTVEYVETPRAVPFYFYIGQDMKTKIIHRLIDEIVLTDTLPTYQAVENGQIVEKVAQFNPSSNPGWTYDEESGTVTYRRKINGSMNMPTLPKLNLEFPGAVFLQTIENNVQARLVPYKKFQDEQDIVLESDVTIQPVQSAGTPVPGGFIKYLKTGKPRFFTEWPTDKDRDFRWDLTFTPGLDDVQAGRYYKNIVYTDLLLDSRMYYKSISLQDKADVADVIAYGAEDRVVEEGITENGLYTFNPDNKDSIIKVVVKLPTEKELSERYIVTMTSRFKDPESVHYDTVNPSANGFDNASILEADKFEADGVSSEAEQYIGTDRIYMNPAKLQIRSVKTQTYPDSGTGANSVVTGEQGTYDLSVRRTFNGEEVESEEYLHPSPDFHMVDLLPKGLDILDKGIVLSPEFAASPGSNFEIIHNFKGEEGQTAIVFTADVLNADVTKIASVKTEIDLRMETGVHTNKLYMAFDKAKSFNQYGLNPEKHDFGQGEKDYMYTQTAFSLLKAEVMQSRKYIRTTDAEWNGTSEWSPYGVVTEGESKFQYMLLLDNNTDHDRLDNRVYDVLPRDRDKVIQMDNAGKRISRGSQFSNKLISVQVEGNNADQYIVEYTNADNVHSIPDGVEAGVFLNSLTWTTEMPTSPTAFRVRPGDGQEGKLEAREQLRIIVNMEAPVRTTQLEGKRGMNSFVRTDSTLNNRYLEANIVYNELPPPRGEISLIKVSEATDEDGKEILLEGAEFTLYDESGRVAAVKTTGPDGKVVFDNIPLGDYRLVETKAPEGYVANFSTTVSRSNWLNKTEYKYDLGKVENPPIYNGTVNIKKLGINNTVLQGVEFTLEKTNYPSRKWTGRTDAKGELSFTDLDKGTYKLTETKTLGKLKPIIGSETFTIDKKDQVVNFTNETAFVNDKASVKIFKIGLAGALDIGLSLADYSAGSGTILKEAWTYELKGDDGSSREIILATNKDTVIDNLVPEVLYKLKEISGPEGSLYLVNPKVYEFKVTATGRLVDGNGKPFVASDIYFPNEKKPMRGEAVVEKKDQDGNALAGVEFTLFKLNEETGEYDVSVEVLTTDAQGLVTFTNILPGSYEIRETKVPEDYAGMDGSFKFIVEKVPTSSMQPPIYDNQEEEVVHKFYYQAVNKKLELEFVKRQPLAEMVSLVEADELISQNPGAVKIQRSDTPFYDVYIPLSGVTYNFYEIENNEDILIKENMVTDTEGKLDFTAIENFVLKPEAVYKLLETKTKDNTWVLNTKPVIIDMREWLQKPGFTGLVSVYQNNYLKKGSVLLSKYDRYTQERLPGVTFTLYQGTLEEVKLPDGSYNDELKVSDKVTDTNGFANYTNLDLGWYVLVETKTLTEQGYHLFEDAFEFELTPDETHFFASVYNMRDKDYFDLPVTKIWYGDAPEYGEKPHEGLIVNLYKGGKLFESAVLSANTEWKHTFERLLKKDDHGRLYKYTLEEVVPEGYDHEMIGIIGAEGVITDLEGNELDPREITLKNYKLMNLTVNKVWDDLDNKFELRPESIVLQLQQNGEDFLDPVTVESDQDGNWTYTFTGLRTHDENNAPYEYTVVEAKLPAYEDPTYTPEADGSITVTNKLVLTEVPVTKNWDDQDDKYGLRPESITLQLQQNGEDFLDPVTVAADADGNWKYSFIDLPKFDVKGEVYKYTVVETKVAHYADPEYDENEDGSITVTNTLPTVDLPLTKNWDDQDDKYGLRPESITLQLQQNGEDFLNPVTVAADADGNWEYSFEKLPKFDKEGNEYKYTVVETKVAHYSDPEYDENEDGSITVTNILPTVDLPIIKIWDDQDDKYGLRPESITLQLQQNGEDFLDPVTVAADAEGNWEYSFEKLPKFDAEGEEYKYTIVETKVAHYSDPEYEENEDGSITVTNILPPLDLSITKTWEDLDNKYGLRPESITLQLQQNGEDFLDPVAVTADAEGNWEYSFEKLPKFDAEGEEYKYTVAETKVPHYAEPEYTVNADGSITITNPLVLINLPVTKIWEDDNNRHGLRPGAIILQLKQNGLDFGAPVTVKADAEGNWQYLFVDLPGEDETGQPYAYSVEERAVAKYKVSYGFLDGKIVITNQLEEVPEEERIIIPPPESPMAKTGENSLSQTVLRSILLALATLMLLIRSLKRKKQEE